MGKSIGVSALWVLVAIVIGGDLLGVVGMVVGVPTFATFYGLLRQFTAWCLERRGIDAEGNPRNARRCGALTCGECPLWVCADEGAKHRDDAALLHGGEQNSKKSS